MTCPCRGAAFETADGKRAVALWTVDSGNGAPDEIVVVPSENDMTA